MVGPVSKGREKTIFGTRNSSRVKGGGKVSHRVGLPANGGHSLPQNDRRRHLRRFNIYGYGVYKELPNRRLSKISTAAHISVRRWRSWPANVGTKYVLGRCRAEGNAGCTTSCQQ